ncbi:MAG: bifunctional aspartate kinase/homoserine dehydrogenase I [Bacteroides sp.]|nr:bifunctional aspartate kinase/homoserine dehydrogenase I [Prevotella sp.]MCM1408382.1 bifunctional aspartate kinase/homoserine dehydrogenase I [Treponema brennaborense]MCM1470387.1 bifunctional aspartate kinase/homoserine dehydrogenase I [Bacteroides sp.]
MVTLKFGGTSMGNARRMLNSAAIIASRAEKERVSVVVSAMAGISNTLQEGIDSCAAGGDPEQYAARIRDAHLAVCGDLKAALPAFDESAASEKLEPVLAECARLLSAVSAFGECPASVHCRIMGTGELLSAPIMEEILRAQGHSVVLIDSRNVIFTTGRQTEGDPDFSRTLDAFKPYREKTCCADKNILLFPGFICSWSAAPAAQTVMGLMGRNGSDFSAAVVGAALNSSRVEFWTDVDGIYTADPRIVKDAILVNDMTYEEAMELSFFGSKILHPKTLAPLAARGIEAWSLNTFNPHSRGTRIASGPFAASEKDGGAVRGISCLKNTAMISVSGAGMKGKSGSAARIFAAVSRAGISMLLITQSSSEYTVSFCVNQSDARRVHDILSAEFELELRENIINLIEVQENCAIVSIVGDGMKRRRGIAGTFFNALASQDINILAIAQGSSERSISVVINGKDGDTAVRITHRFCFNTAQTIEVFAFGAGTIGGCLLDQIRDQQSDLAKQGIDIRVLAIANVSGMILDRAGLELADWRSDIEKNGRPTNLDEILAFVREIKPLNPVFVDCTASYDLPNRYLDILHAGMHIATPNKRANSMSMDFYRKLRAAANRMRRRFLYETNVGAGLPVIDTLQNLFKSGDRLTGFYGIMSGSLSYIFGRLDEGAAFSEAVREARGKRFTEPDPRDDLAGTDVARKALIIAREAGMEIELEDIKIDRIFPDDFDDSGTVEQFMEKLPLLDPYFAEKTEALKKAGKVLRMGASIENGVCTVGMMEVDKEHPLYSIRGGENAFVFRTERYTPIPMTVRGYGAGAGVTAAGVFGDILRTVSWNLESNENNG